MDETGITNLPRLTMDFWVFWLSLLWSYNQAKIVIFCVCLYASPDAAG